MSQKFHDPSVEVKAISYILTKILQRLDAAKPDFVSEFLADVRSDREDVISRGNTEGFVYDIFDKALKLLEDADLNKAIIDLK